MFQFERADVDAAVAALKEALPQFMKRTPLWVFALVIPLTYTVLRCIYLLYLHPLSKFPGPKIGAVSHIYYSVSW